MWHFREGEVLLFHKPPKMSSFGLVKFVRKRIQEPGTPKIKVGHAGTLDPLAEGLMVICTGKATRRAMELTAQDKRYRATFWLGQTSASDDLETEPEPVADVQPPSETQIRKALEHFTGVQMQVPPVFSAKKIDGKRAFKSARKGQHVEMRPAPVEVFSMELLRYEWPELELHIHCSKGTYIRSLARDLGEHLGCGALMSALLRTAVGQFQLDQAMTMEAFKEALAKADS
jgi:tRNA pseudouridine55 synthase